MSDPKDKGKKPIVFIRGHAGKWTVNTKKVLDNVPCDNDLIQQHEGFWYDENTHFPFIAEYAYKDNMEKKLRAYDKSSITTKLFADSLVELLESQGLTDVDMIGASVGGNVAMLTTPSSSIDRVSVVSPTMPFSLLADIDELENIKNKSILNRIVYLVSKIYMDQSYGFVRDMGQTFKDSGYVKNLIVPNKIFIQAGAVNHVISRNPVDAFLEFAIVKSAETITKATGRPSDGAVVTDPNYYQELGVDYEVYDDNYHIYCDQTEHILKRAYDSLGRINTKVHN